MILQSLSSAAMHATELRVPAELYKNQQTGLSFLLTKARPGVNVNVLILSMFSCRVSFISEKHHKGHHRLMQTNTPSVNFFGDESLFIAVNERHGGQLFLPV